MRNSAAALLLLALLAASGCQRGGQRRIAVVPKATSHLFWINVEQGVRAAGRELGVEILWNGASSETDYTRQVQIVDSMIARKVDAIAVAATEQKILVQSLERAAAAGIPVTVFDSGVASDNYLTFVSTNNYEGGVLAARTLAELTGAAGPAGPKVKVAMLAHQPGSSSTMLREQGFEETLQKEFPRLEIAARQFSMSDRAKGRAAAENFLTAQTGLAGVFASAEPGSVGAALAIKGRGLSGKVRLVTFDSSDGLIEDLRGGTIDAMIVQDPYKMGYQAVQSLVDRLNGKQIPKRIDLTAQLVRKADLEKPDIMRLLNLNQNQKKP